MACEWLTASFAESPLQIIDGDRGKHYPNLSEFHDSGHCLFLNAGNVTAQGFEFSKCAFIDVDKDAQLGKGKLNRNDIVLTTRGTVGNVAFYNSSAPYEHIRINSGMVILRPDKNQIFPVFLYMFLRSPSFKSQVAALLTGSAQPQLPVRDIMRLRLPIPTLPEQRAIAHILGTLDDKIELNRQMNQTLEAIAQALFKSWFVDFEPFREQGMQDSPLGEIPVGWMVGKVDDITVLHRVSVNPSDYSDEVFDHYSIPAFDEGQLPKAETGNEIRSNKFQVPYEAVLISKLNPRFPRVWIPLDSNSRRSVSSTEFLVVTSRGNATREYLYSLFCSKSFLETFSMLVTGTSSSHQRVRPEDLMSINIAIPPAKVTTNFSATVQPLLTLVNRNIVQNSTLAAIRDALLPKLLSGEIRVNDAQTFVGETV